jgi:hypothetical protein
MEDAGANVDERLQFAQGRSDLLYRSSHVAQLFSFGIVSPFDL